MKKNNWQKSLQESIIHPRDLLEYLSLDQQHLVSLNIKSTFPIKVTREYASRINKNDINDPLLKQILSFSTKPSVMPGYSNDPLQETDYIKAPGLLHKYQGRVLVTITGACAIHCRYCFRQNFSYDVNTPSRTGWKKIVDYIRSDSSISEVIYSGGDPLMAKDNLLADLTKQLADIKHLKRLRIHTRLPVVLPSRVCDDFLEWLSETRLQKVIVLHVNHPNEIDEDVNSAIQKLIDNKITVLNQSVLLRGVNDSVDVLATLSEKLFACGVLPYYLHMLDKVSGAESYEVPELEAQALYAALRTRLSGFLLPRLVREVPGELSKIAQC